ncbi:hypothetical protein PR202_ga15496 [Eleusine coracana subsp. coracana]|uniref:Uncharacterized protein n=1 Tax=Eleusine coracana subsp. coracana TaxID=191504 RepID=A0AAV5CKC3_ELECO|nr:hypothetical protein PR202_ga15496 [Eleusine coracana subsp. coracana]
MARILASGATASAGLGASWLFGLCVFVVSVWVVTFAVFICGHSHDDDDRPKKKPAPVKKAAPAKASRGAARSGMVVDTSGMYVAAYSGCSGGHHHGGGRCGGGGHHGGGGCGGGGGGGGRGGCGGGGC